MKKLLIFALVGLLVALVARLADAAPVPGWERSIGLDKAVNPD